MFIINSVIIVNVKIAHPTSTTYTKTHSERPEIRYYTDFRLWILDMFEYAYSATVV